MSPAASEAEAPAAGPAAKRTRGPRHPLGVLPFGQQLLDGRVRNLLRHGLGPLLGALSDDLLLALLAALGPRELGAIGRVCRALHVFASSEEL
ncbi:hypothetical protein T492DRAFT_876922, partial [Pavlovales sp. CCMP2436]